MGRPVAHPVKFLFQLLPPLHELETVPRRRPPAEILQLLVLF